MQNTNSKGVNTRTENTARAEENWRAENAKKKRLTAKKTSFLFFSFSSARSKNPLKRLCFLLLALALVSSPTALQAQKASASKAAVKETGDSALLDIVQK